MGVAVPVDVIVGLAVGVPEKVTVGVSVGVELGTGEVVLVGLGVDVPVDVGVGVTVWVGLDVAVPETVQVKVGVEGAGGKEGRGLRSQLHKSIITRIKPAKRKLKNIFMTSLRMFFPTVDIVTSG